MEATYLSSQQDRQWIDLALEGDLTAFNQLILSYQDMVFRIAKWMVNDEASAEDIVQTVFLIAYHRMGSFRGHNFRGWLLRMVYKACMDKLRRRKRHLYQTLQPQEAGEAMETAKRSIHASQTPKATLIQHEACEWIEQCLYRLPVPLLSVMILIDLEYFDYTEAANILGIPLGTVKSRLGQARMRMAQILREEKKT